VVGEAGDGREALHLARTLRPGVVLMDIRMPELDGIEAIRRLLTRQDPGGPRVLVLTTFDLDGYVYEAMKSGASGFLLKDVPDSSSSRGSEPLPPVRSCWLQRSPAASSNGSCRHHRRAVAYPSRSAA